MGDEGWDDVAVRRQDRRLRALIADDDEGIRRLLTTVLELDGWDVRCAADGDEAVAMAEAYHPDAVLLDIMMPNTDGLTALRRIRANDANDGMAVVMVSALGEGDTRAEAAAAGADDYLVKPEAIGQVGARVLKLVRGAGLPSAR
jgi:two-component system OmpR family response regulator